MDKKVKFKISSEAYNYMQLIKARCQCSNMYPYLSDAEFFQRVIVEGVKYFDIMLQHYKELHPDEQYEIQDTVE